MIVDAFPFHNELDLLKKRLMYLSPVVDKFILVESTYTHRGEPKELYFDKNKDMFDEWKDQLVHVILDVVPPDSDPWTMEHMQRNHILEGLEGVPDDAIVMISDLDEVPNTEMVKRLPDLDVDIISVHMITFNYSIDYYQTFEKWFGTVISTKKHVIEKKPQYFRDSRWNFPYIEYGGWHFSSFGDEAFLANKLRSCAECYDEGVDENMAGTYMKEKLSHNGKFKLTPSPPNLIASVPDIFK
jgi:beta-1,4-mannosyl-glycoprotein beta-1,4-N-acetylglucosaminyltransferase